MLRYVYLYEFYNGLLVMDLAFRLPTQINWLVANDLTRGDRLVGHKVAEIDASCTQRIF